MHSKRWLAVACTLALAAPDAALAQDATGALRSQIEALQRQLDEMKAQLQKVQLHGRNRGIRGSGVPLRFDWREKGIVTEARSQGVFHVLGK